MAATAVREMPSVSTKERNLSKDSKLNCVIAKGTQIQGNIKASESIRLDGVLIGDVICDKKVVIGAKGRVEGKIKASDAYVMGEVQGEMIISGTLQLESTARVNGNLSAKNLVVDEGATMDGDFKIGA
jgi:cytoskeletal protein CcmA (bactofilin family)